MKKRKLIVVGNGMAGIRTVEEILKSNPSIFEITVFGDEPRVNYNRMLLSPILSGEKQFSDIILNDKEWYEENNISLRLGEKIISIDRAKKYVLTNKGENLAYDSVLLATGSRPIILPIPGSDLEGVVLFRDLDDVEKMLKASQSGSKAIVIGGGLLGLEAAYGLYNRGMSVTVIHLMDRLMERQLDDTAGHILQRALEQKGIKFCMKTQTEAILGKNKVDSIQFKDGTKLEADIIVMAVGIKPNSQLALDSGLECQRGILVDDWLQTSDPNIFAVGECVEHRGQCYGLVAPLFEMAKICAARMINQETSGYEGSVTATRLKVTGIDLFSAGDFIGNDQSEDIIFCDEQSGIYKKIVVQNNRVIGTVLYGDTQDGTWYFDLIKSSQDISDFRSKIIFGQSFINSKANDDDLMSMSDDTQICGCNGVSKKTIVEAIHEKKLTSLEDIKSHTKASASCGQCSNLVQKILVSTLGKETLPVSIPKLCLCSDQGHDSIRSAIKEQALKTIQEVMQALHWKTRDGCAKCRPALNYYLLCAWPGEYHDHQPSRFINERVHANIQKDGTYSVVPRMWGGLTTAKELRAIADVVDKFHIPTVKVTGGQRIDLLGVAKEDLPAVWADLNAAGMVSGHAYAKGLRTVKTCVGSEWCRFGTQDSTGLGVKLEKMTWGSWTPHKFKMAVSGCPRNCAEASIKDLGIVCVEGGYKIMVGGNGGIDLRETDFLCQVSTEEEVFEYVGAFMQIYREEAWYLERTAPWIERVGIDYVRDRLLNNKEERHDAYLRFIHSQTFFQEDPWNARASQGVDSHEFKALYPVES
jgi:nitrite reductase (NADH) large subunit